MVHLSFHYKTTNLITFKNLCPLKKHILQQERYSTQNCFPNHVIRILYHYSARSKHISQECKCTSLLIDCVLILNKEKTSLKLKKLQNNFIPVKMGTGCYYGPSKSRIPNCLWHVTRLNNNSLPNKKKKKKTPPNYRPNGWRWLGRLLKILLCEAKTGLSRPNLWQMVVVVLMMMIM